jgi:hypothetical protein
VNASKNFWASFFEPLVSSAIFSISSVLFIVCSTSLYRLHSSPP